MHDDEATSRVEAKDVGKNKGTVGTGCQTTRGMGGCKRAKNVLGVRASGVAAGSDPLDDVVESCQTSSRAVQTPLDWHGTCSLALGIHPPNLATPTPVTVVGSGVIGR